MTNYRNIYYKLLISVIGEKEITGNSINFNWVIDYISILAFDNVNRVTWPMHAAHSIKLLWLCYSMGKCWIDKLAIRHGSNPHNEMHGHKCKLIVLRRVEGDQIRGIKDTTLSRPHYTGNCQVNFLLLNTRNTP